MKRHVSSCRVFFLSVLITCTVLAGNTSFAHVGADDMPDSVAEVEYTIYLEFKPNDLKVRNKLGMVYYRMNKLPEASREFSRILKKDPDNYDAMDGMGLVKAAQQQFDEAIDLHQKAIALNPEDMMVYYHLGSALEKKNRLPEAVEAYRAALEKFNEQYPIPAGNKQATEFADKVRAAISQLETGLK